MLDNQRENQCFHDIGCGRWGDEHSKVLKWADEHPVSPWVNVSDRMPDKPGEYLVVIQTSTDARYMILTYYNKQYRRFEYYDSYDDSVSYYHKKDVFAWMKVPDYKNL